MSIKKLINQNKDLKIDVIIFCDGIDVCETLKSFNVPVLNKDHYDKKFKIDFFFGTEQYKWYTFKKPHIISNLIKLNEINNIIFSDPDCIFLRNDIFNDLRKYEQNNNDIVFQSDNPTDNIKDKTNINSGFYYIINKKKIYELFENWNIKTNQFYNASYISGDQDIIQNILKEHTITFNWKYFKSHLLSKRKSLF